MFHVVYSARGYANTTPVAIRAEADNLFADEVKNAINGSPKFEVVEVDAKQYNVLRRVHVVYKTTRRVWYVIQMSES